MEKNDKDGRYFTIAELCKSTIARARGIANVPSLEEEQHLGTLIKCMLDPVREQWKRPIYVSSGYRSLELNAAVGGVTDSYHMRGMAADIYTADDDFGDTKTLFELMQHLYIENRLRVTECYYDREHDFIHVAYDPEDLHDYPFWTE